MIGRKGRKKERKKGRLERKKKEGKGKGQDMENAEKRRKT